MSHGSYDLNLVLKRLILVGDIRSISWPNIGDSYGKTVEFLRNPAKIVINSKNLKNVKKHNFLTVFQGFLVLGPILMHQTKFKLSV